ncbi:MAG: hypothetical protein LC659_05335, partial [Myxococcales bacterium]|nr:hypothetical protein [Myxococcales bacterium]
TTRSKGSVGFGFYVKHGDDVRLADPDENVAPGDALRFFYTAPEGTRLAIVSVDPAGRASVYHPAGDQLAPVGAAHQQLLDESIVLDDSVGTEQLYALFCDRDQPSAPLLRAVAEGRAPPDGCRASAGPFTKGGRDPQRRRARRRRPRRRVAGARRRRPRALRGGHRR